MQKAAVQQALNFTGFSICNFKGDGQDECSQCEKPISVGANVYYERTCYESDEGEYYCEQCLINTPERMKKDADSWADYAQDNNLV